MRCTCCVVGRSRKNRERETQTDRDTDSEISVCLSPSLSLSLEERKRESAITASNLARQTDTEGERALEGRQRENAMNMLCGRLVRNPVFG